MPGTKHIGAEKPSGGSSGEIAETVIVPGDPLRAKWIAENFLTDAKEVSKVRNMLGYTGTFKGVPVTVMGSGMGMAGASIYFTELVTEYKCKNLIRIGSCGTVMPNVKLGDVVIGMAAGTDSKMQRIRFLDHDHACTADFDLLRLAVDECEAMEKGSDKGKFHVGKLFTSDYFYHPQMSELFPLMRKYNYMGVEMEASALYGVASEYGARALAMCTVSDEIYLPEDTKEKTGGKETGFSFKGMSADDRENTFKNMVNLALNVAVKAKDKFV